MSSRASVLVAVGLTGLVLVACPKKEDAPPAAPPDSGVAAVGPGSGDIPPPADVAAPPATAEKTKTGLASVVIKSSTVAGAEKPEVQDSVRVHYTGWTTDGKMFDSSVKRGQPAMFPLKNVIPGWTEGMQLMQVGEKRRFWIPEELAYKGRPGAPAGMLVFDVELLGVIRGPKPIPAPEDVAAAPADAAKTTSGIASKVLQPGTGKQKPNPEDTVKVHYTGWTTDGVMFDSSMTRGEPIEFPLNRVIPGWTEGVGMMVVGEKRRLWIPEELAYKGRPGAPAGMLVFDVELLDIKAGKKPIAAPADVKAPPKDAKKTASGLAYKVLKKGTGKEKPGPTSMVEVHYTGWTTDGKMFDSSVQREQPAAFRLDQVIKGWTEGVALMVKGEKTRFWIPEELAYKGMPGAPQGMLVFEVELLDIKAAAQ
jgi:FKBP-type peptidyl-prolyl cis-trans isomerase